jgi:hypothetical protein
MSLVRVRWNLVRTSIRHSSALHMVLSVRVEHSSMTRLSNGELCDLGKGQNPKPGSQRHVDSKRLLDESCSGLICIIMYMLLP